MLEAIPESQDDANAKNRKRKKAVQKRKKGLDIIPEEESSENEFDREHQEALEAFDAISVAKKHNNHPKLSNGYLPTPTNFSPQPSTSYASMTTSNFSKSRNTAKGGRN